MTFIDYLPGIIVAGYALTGVLAWAASKLHARLPRERSTDGLPGPPPPAGAAPIAPQAGLDAGEKSRIRRWRRSAIWAAVIVGLATTVVWLVAAIDLSGILTTTGVFLGLIVFALAMAYAMDTESGAKKFFGTIVAVILTANFWFLTLAPLLHVLGLAKNITITVTSSSAGLMHSRTGTASSVQGTYSLDGAGHRADFIWLGWHNLPQAGDRVAAGISPVWPHQIYATSLGAWFMLAVSIGVPILLGVCFVAGNRGSRRIRNRRG